MKVLYLTREYPPHVYGGAGVHVEFLAREMAHIARVEVRCFGEQDSPFTNPSVKGYPFVEGMFEGNPRRVKTALMTLLTCMHFNAEPIDADVVHTHTWYAAWGGILAKICYGVSLVVTVHSLEPLRPWKREQLGRGYDLSSWVEKTALEMADAIIAVSKSDREEILSRFDVKPQKVKVLPNGIDTKRYRKVKGTGALERYGVDPSFPYVLFLGRVSRQKGIHHFIRASQQLDKDVGIVMCASSPDTPELALEIEKIWKNVEEKRKNAIWIREMVTRDEAIELYSHAALFCCPSIYEPFGIINLEAMACETPVVASAVGGIKEVVVDGETGFLLRYERRSENDHEPKDPEKFAHDLARGMMKILSDPELSMKMGLKGRERVEREFGWDKVAEKVMSIYQEIKKE